MEACLTDCSYDTGSINGILEMPYFKKQFSNGAVDAAGEPYITAKETSLIVAILSLGTIAGTSPSCPLHTPIDIVSLQDPSPPPRSPINSAADGE